MSSTLVVLVVPLCNFIILFLTSLVAGGLVKYVDHLEDEMINTENKMVKDIKTISLGVLYGIMLFLITSYTPKVTVLIIATVVGMILSGKIDAPGHRAGVAVLFSLFALFGLPFINPFYFIIIMLVSVLDECMDTLADKVKNQMLKRFLSLRPLLEVIVFLISFFSGIWALWVTLLGFDIGYNVLKLKIKK